MSIHLLNWFARILTQGGGTVILPHMMTIDETAARLGVSRHTINKWISTGQLIPSDRGVYNSVLFSEDVIEPLRDARAKELKATLEGMGYIVTLESRVEAAGAETIPE